MSDVSPTPNATEPNANDKNIVVLTHLGGIIFSFIPALVVWLLKKDENAYIGAQAREALNFQVTVIIAHIISWVLMFILIGVFLMVAVWIANIVLCIMAAVAASKGEPYQYPFALRLIS